MKKRTFLLFGLLAMLVLTGLRRQIRRADLDG